MELTKPLEAETFADNPFALRHLLQERGTLTFQPYASGLFPASDLTPEEGEATGMTFAWLRDNAHVANALYEAGDHRPSIAVGNAMLRFLSNNRQLLDNVVEGRDTTSRLPIRVDGHTLENDAEPRIQNDSVGYTLWFTSKLLRNGALQPVTSHLNVLAQTVRYLETIEYWHDEDAGHWEEDHRIQASSIGVVAAGLREAEQMFHEVEYPHDIDIRTLRQRGEAAMYAILDQGLSDLKSTRPSTQDEQPYPSTIQPNHAVQHYFEHFNPNRREHDAALLFLIEPLNILEREGYAEMVVRGITQHLQREKGIVRYEADTYWEPRFPSIMPLKERLWAAQTPVEARNKTAAGVGYTGTEAQWTLFDPLLSEYWGKRFLETGNSEAHQNQLSHLNRSLAQLVLTDDDQFLLPEAYYHEYQDDFRLIPNTHTPLLWSQANLLRALKVFEATEGTPA